MITELISLALKNQTKDSENKPKRKRIPFAAGNSYFIRTVTFHLTGRVKEIIGNFLILEDAAWIAWSARFMETIDEGAMDEVEPVFKKIQGNTYVNINAITDAFDWKHKLPREQQ